MNENFNDKNFISALLRVYSIQEITAIFSEIDEKILSLHECSSDDFLTLNAYFKKYYADSKTISQNASGLFNLITNEDNQKNFYDHLGVFQDTLHQLMVSYEKMINQVIHSIQSMTHEMDHMFITGNNLKQDLMTLKLLVANLKLDVTISTSVDNKMVRKTNDFNELIIQTKSFFVEFYKRSTFFKESIKSLGTQLVQQRDKNLQHINEILSEINYSTKLFEQRNAEAVKHIPTLSNNTQNTSNSIAKIITNLQYQDIIRQKIDHIQQTHKDILKELNNINESGTEQVDTETKVKCFLQIRDVAGLQAAQLIHANKEYQKAIEVISGRFLEVGNDMTNISELCHQITGNSNGSGTSHFDEIREKMEKSRLFSDIFMKSIDFLKERGMDYEEQLADLINNYAELCDFIVTIEKSINKSLKNQTSNELGQYEKTIQQIHNILSELQSITSQYQNQFEKIKNLCFCYTAPKVIGQIEEEHHDFKTKFEELIHSLFEKNENIFKILSDNQALSKKISLEIKTSLEQIKYYDYFDKVIEDIISKLNEINMKLQNVDNYSEEERQKHLDYLKERYTMESEHIIHDHLSKNDVDILQLNSTGADEDDDNLELF